MKMVTKITIVTTMVTLILAGAAMAQTATGVRTI